MKRTIIITLTVGLVVALAVVAYSSYKRYSRPNLLVDGSFDAGEGLSKSWYQLEPSEQGSFGKTEDGAAYVDTIGIVDSERNPFCEHVLAQAVEVEVREPRTFILTGKAKRLTGTGTALVQLSVHGIKQISNSDSLRLDKGVGKWRGFRPYCDSRTVALRG
ncbi:MAG: hypothetical protein U5N86_09185 [Planctomycetota bacterium]|nr:hypothetical protein [Planctomycetota bacterium]